MPKGTRFRKVIRGRLYDISHLQAAVLMREEGRWSKVADGPLMRKVAGRHWYKVFEGLVYQGLMRSTKAAYILTPVGRKMASFILD